MSVSPSSFKIRPFVGAVRSEVAPFGALTLAGDGGYQVNDNGGNPLSSAELIATGTASGFEITASGVVTPVSDGTAATEDGKTLIVVDGNTKVELTLSVQAGEYSITGNAELNGTFSSGRTLRLRDGSYGGGRGTVLTSKNPVSTVTVKAYNRDACIFTTTYVENSSNIILDNLTFAQASGDQLLLYGSGGNTTDDITIQNCHIYGTVPLDPDGDYSVSGPSSPGGIELHGGSTHSNITILNNEIHDVRIGITAGEGRDTLRIEGNNIYRVYDDCIKITAGPTTTLVKYNYLGGVVAAGTDDGNPHPDFLQFIGGGADWTGIEIEGNILLHLYSRAAAQGIFLDDVSEGFYFSGTRVVGNVVVNSGNTTTGIRISRVKDCFVAGNTVVNPGFGDGRAGIAIGESWFAGVNVAKNNVTQTVNFPGVTTDENNVILGNDGATISFGTAFVGPTFTPTTRAEVLSMFAMKPNGPLDADNSGGPSVGDVGAIGSGYVTWPSTFPGFDGSVDGAYE